MATRNWSSEEYVTDTKQVGDAAIVTNTLLQAKLIYDTSQLKPSVPTSPSSP